MCNKWKYHESYYMYLYTSQVNIYILSIHKICTSIFFSFHRFIPNFKINLVCILAKHLKSLINICLSLYTKEFISQHDFILWTVFALGFEGMGSQGPQSFCESGVLLIGVGYRTRYGQSIAGPEKI